MVTRIRRLKGRRYQQAARQLLYVPVPFAPRSNCALGRRWRDRDASYDKMITEAKYRIDVIYKRLVLSGCVRCVPIAVLLRLALSNAHRPTRADLMTLGMAVDDELRDCPLGI